MRSSPLLHYAQMSTLRTEETLTKLDPKSVILFANLGISHPRPVLMIVVYDNWVTVGSAILHMRVIPWEVVMGMLHCPAILLRPPYDPANQSSPCEQRQDSKRR